MSNDSEDAYETLMQFLYRAPIGLAQTGLDGEVEMINPMSAQLLMPLSRDGSLSNLFAVLRDVAPELPAMVAAFEPAFGVICDSVRLIVGPRLGSDREPVVLSVSLLKIAESRLMAVLNDVTIEARREQQGLERRLHDAARTDALTQMPNRSVVRDRLQQALDHAPSAIDEQFAVLFLNCDRFKQINDALGHAVGDGVLSLVADRLRSSLRQRNRTHLARRAEQLAARTGGDEFAVFLDDLRHPDEVHAVAQRLLDVLSKPYGVGQHQLHCSFSIGVVLQAQARGDADAVLQDASVAMVEAKRAGGARYVVFEPAMAQRAARRGGVEADLRRAIDRGELFVVYQPVLALQGPSQGCGCAGVEALVRWAHPTRGVVPPLEFIGVAEECSLIGAIGDFVLETACRQFTAWRQALGERAPQSMAVNLSRAQLDQPGWAEKVAAVLAATGMPAERLQLEVTESLAAQDEQVQERLHELKALGLTLALDDFGTGYSSLASLHLLPVDTVKIDRSFTSQADISHHHRVLIEATVRVANSLGMSTVAEGIESEAQAAVVRSLGCSRGQGYLYSKPLPATALADWLVQPARLSTPPGSQPGFARLQLESARQSPA